MNPEKFRAIILDIIRKDRRYSEEAYYFVNEGVGYASEMLQKPQFGAARHLSIKELLEAISDFALNEFGAMAVSVLQTWGLNTTLDIGHVVFNLIDANILSASSDDKLGDFDEVFDLRARLKRPFLAENPLSNELKSIDS